MECYGSEIPLANSEIDDDGSSLRRSAMFIVTNGGVSQAPEERNVPDVAPPELEGMFQFL
jgi:hypothetical protein